MTVARRPIGVALTAAMLVLCVPGTVGAGNITGVGASRTAHLSDASNGVNVTVAVPETFEGYTDNVFTFRLEGGPSNPGSSYTLEVALSPDDPDTRAAWNATVTLAPGVSNQTATVQIPHDTIKGTHPNTPFRFALRAAGGLVLDQVDAGIDVRYRTPPADGGLLQLALATTAFWALVFLYALHLHSNERKLRARADALERSLQGAHKDDPAPGPNR